MEKEVLGNILRVLKKLLHQDRQVMCTIGVRLRRISGVTRGRPTLADFLAPFNAALESRKTCHRHGATYPFFAFSETPFFILASQHLFNRAGEIFLKRFS